MDNRVNRFLFKDKIYRVPNQTDLLRSKTIEFYNTNFVFLAIKFDTFFTKFQKKIFNRG